MCLAGNMRTEFDAETLPARSVYKLLTALVIPRPIAWVSTVDANGLPNLAPHSFFTVASSDPGIVQFTSVLRKDTLRNIEATGEFVVNFAPRSLMDQINTTSIPLPENVSEFEVAGLRLEPSHTVAPPRVADSPAALECTLHQVIEVGNSFLVLGLVKHVSINASMIDGAGHPDPALLDPVSRMGSNQWGALGEVLHVDRPTLDQWRKSQAREQAAVPGSDGTA